MTPASPISTGLHRRQASDPTVAMTAAKVAWSDGKLLSALWATSWTVYPSVTSGEYDCQFVLVTKEIAVLNDSDSLGWGSPSDRGRKARRFPSERSQSMQLRFRPRQPRGMCWPSEA